VRAYQQKSASREADACAVAQNFFATLLLVATLVASLTKQLAVLLLRHTLAALLDY